MSLTFGAVCAAWVLFRAPNLRMAGAILKRLVLPREGAPVPLAINSFLWLAGIVVLCHVVAANGTWKRWATRIPEPVLGCAYAALAIVSLVLAPDSGKAFIYFQF
jgi:hypothetical protein